METEKYKVTIDDNRTVKQPAKNEVLKEIGFNPEDKDFDRYSFRDSASDSVSDGNEDVYRWDRDNYRVYYHSQGNYFTITDKDETWRDYFKGWDTDAYNCDFYTLLAAFRLNPELEAVDKDHKGECRVWIEYFYNRGTINAPFDGWVTEGTDDRPSSDIRIFKNKEEAQQWTDEAERGTYYLSHGEYSRPTYTICEA